MRHSIRISGLVRAPLPARRLPLGILPLACFLLLAACGGQARDARLAKGFPVLTLRGSAVVVQPLGTKYVDAGATAEDARQADISARIEMRGLKAVDVSTTGDYLVRYVVTNSRGKTARAVRIVRVSGGKFMPATARPLGSTAAGMGYYEHLPADYGKDPSKKFPLLIWNHGWGNSRDFGSRGYELQLLNNLDIFQAIQGDSWNQPLIVLMPQRNLWDVSGRRTYTQLRAFIHYALDTYQVDSSRIYMGGFSDGAYVTWMYLVNYPGQIAAAVPVAGYALWVDGCSIRTPVWAFQNKDDPVVTWQSTLSTVEAINRSSGKCKPPERARFTLFPSGGHSPSQALYRDENDLGDPAYDIYKPDVFSWLLEHHTG